MPLMLCDLDDTLVPRRGFFRGWATTYLAEIGAHHRPDLEAYTFTEAVNWYSRTNHGS